MYLLHYLYIDMYMNMYYIYIYIRKSLGHHVETQLYWSSEGVRGQPGQLFLRSKTSEHLRLVIWTRTKITDAGPEDGLWRCQLLGELAMTR